MEAQKSLGSKKIWKNASSGQMADDSGNIVDSAEASRRLIALRQLRAGENQALFAAQIGIEYKRWNNFERGKPLSKDVAFRLVRIVPGLTLDWLFLGKEEGLPVSLQRELAAALAAVTSPTKRGV